MSQENFDRIIAALEAAGFESRREDEWTNGTDRYWLAAGHCPERWDDDFEQWYAITEDWLIECYCE